MTAEKITLSSNDNEELKELAQRIANLAEMPYCWEDIYNRLIAGHALPFMFQHSPDKVVTHTLKEIDEITGGNINPEFWYEKGDEPKGCVRTYCYMDKEMCPTGLMHKDEAIRILKFKNP